MDATYNYINEQSIVASVRFHEHPEKAKTMKEVRDGYHKRFGKNNRQHKG
jgi:hypothetical protein